MRGAKGLATPYDRAVLDVLLYESAAHDESGAADRVESERKIERRLRDKRLGPYEQERIDALRALVEDVTQELSRSTGSSFYARSHGKYADMQDWDFDRLLEHLAKRHPKVSKPTMRSFLPLAIYWCYLR